jgi:hypothetical protein
VPTPNWQCGQQHAVHSRLRLSGQNISHIRVGAATFFFGQFSYLPTVEPLSICLLSTMLKRCIYLGLFLLVRLLVIVYHSSFITHRESQISKLLQRFAGIFLIIWIEHHVKMASFKIFFFLFFLNLSYFRKIS